MKKQAVRNTFLVAVTVAGLVTGHRALRAQQTGEVQELLNLPVLSKYTTMDEVQKHLETKVPSVPKYEDAQTWQNYAESLRRVVLDKVVFRGEAAHWRTLPGKVEWLDTIKGGEGYHLKKLRYEVVPGMWVPAVLYEPDQVTGKVPVVLNVNGHDPNGKAAVYKQLRCINYAKRGMVALNVEWFNMGQLRGPGFSHYKLNQLDLLGTSGMAPFYLNLSRGLDLLLNHPNADPKRVMVTGLSGGGWQTIFFSALDTRVTLANPVAGYSSFLTRIRHLKDLGDSEQTPNDLAKYADYTHLTALLAPRHALLTYNAKDECCFEAGYALPPLMEAAEPVYRLFANPGRLRSHVNHEPGTHNYEVDNRQANYRAVGDYFFPREARFNASEIASQAEVKTAAELNVPLPANNEDFQSLALKLATNLPRPVDAHHKKLRELVRTKGLHVEASPAGPERDRNGVHVVPWRLRLEQTFTVPAIELDPGSPHGTTILIADGGRTAVAAHAEQLLAAGQRVLAVDPFYFGESRLAERDFLFALLLASVGDRPLGLQASEVMSIARWARARWGREPVTVRAVGPRTSTIALVSAALEASAIGKLELYGCLDSFREVIQQGRGVNEWPEMFCFGLFESFDIGDLAKMIAPRPIRFVKPTALAQAAPIAATPEERDACACR